MITQCCSLLLLLSVPSLGVPWHLQLSFGLPYQPPHQSICKVVLTVNIEQLSALLLTESLLPLQMENLLKSYGQLAINLFLNCGNKMQMLKSLTILQHSCIWWRWGINISGYIFHLLRPLELCRVWVCCNTSNFRYPIQIWGRTVLSMAVSLTQYT